MEYVADHEVISRLRDEMVSHLKKKLAISDDALLRVQVVECLKYLSLASLGFPGPIPVSREIDEVWHQLILETREYRRLCARLPGRRFLNHTSLEKNMGRLSPAEMLDYTLSWIASYVVSFGPFTADRVCYWPSVEFVTKHFGWSLAEVNQLGYEMADCMLPRQTNQSQ